MTTSRRIGILGGTFDPIHYGHLIIAEEIRHALALERVLFLPAGQPPHKQGIPVSQAADRVAMVRLAIADNPAFEVCLHDIERGGLSYTADTLTALTERFAGADIHFIMGEDSLEDLPTWHDPERIMRTARLAVALRPGVQVDLTRLEEALPGVSARVDLVATLEIGIASRDLRARVAAGRPIRYQAPDAVVDYVAARGLYRSPAR